MNHKEELRKKIIKVCPDILDLKFGCQVTVDFDKDNKQKGWFFIDKDKEKILFYDENTDSCKHLWGTKFKIIGRPIQLSDILRAINKKLVPINDSYYITDDGGIHKLKCSDDEGCEYCSEWNLEKPYNEQSEETIKFLYNLLK